MLNSRSVTATTMAGSGRVPTGTPIYSSSATPANDPTHQCPGASPPAVPLPIPAQQPPQQQTQQPIPGSTQPGVAERHHHHRHLAKPESKRRRPSTTPGALSTPAATTLPAPLRSSAARNPTKTPVLGQPPEVASTRGSSVRSSSPRGVTPSRGRSTTPGAKEADLSRVSATLMAGSPAGRKAREDRALGHMKRLAERRAHSVAHLQRETQRLTERLARLAEVEKELHRAQADRDQALASLRHSETVRLHQTSLIGVLTEEIATLRQRLAGRGAEPPAPVSPTTVGETTRR
ncbi:hypothetical protein PAPYR_6292 [Paratrimastix pyriformis]|uniref:Uncharacterized protein n=1 Tax=Paratrimastix pyriformis TaxID=342808 RepID=A0ABQ8UI08_9EUKA|nr:hypothetical protein PAPYR_6292 [Paratrimastix pyriformis]